MAKASNPVPPGFQTVTPHLTIRGAADYIDFLKRAFSAVEISRAPGPGGKLMHAEVRIGNAIVMLNDDFPEFGLPPLAQGRLPVALHVYVPDVDSLWAQATAAGCQVTMPLDDQFWGDRYGQVTDPSGFTWSLATHKEDLTTAEMQERLTKMFGSHA
ncbi:MAG: VOC family protein [Bryobacteraceae bacterium]